MNGCATALGLGRHQPHLLPISSALAFPGGRPAFTVKSSQHPPRQSHARHATEVKFEKIVDTCLAAASALSRSVLQRRRVHGAGSNRKSLVL